MILLIKPRSQRLLVQHNWTVLLEHEEQVWVSLQEVGVQLLGGLDGLTHPTRQHQLLDLCGSKSRHGCITVRRGRTPVTAERLTLSVFDGGQLLVHGLVCGFGKSFSCGTITVMHQVGGDHPDGTGNTSVTTVRSRAAARVQAGALSARRSTITSNPAARRPGELQLPVGGLPDDAPWMKPPPSTHRRPIPHQMEIKSIQDE